MSATLIIILISVAAVGLFVLGLSITIIAKGHYMKSEIADNENMQRLGIKCAAQQMREMESCPEGDEVNLHDCGSCTKHCK